MNTKCGNFYIFSKFANIEPHHPSQRGLLTTSPMWYGVGWFAGRIIRLPMILECFLFYWRWIYFLNICSQNMLVSTFCDYTYPIASACDMLTWDCYHDLLYCRLIFHSNALNTYIGSVSCRESSFPLMKSDIVAVKVTLLDSGWRAFVVGLLLLLNTLSHRCDGSTYMLHMGLVALCYSVYCTY